jgi:hypothetical protein
MSEKLAMPRQVINHRKRSHDAGIRFDCAENLTQSVMIRLATHVLLTVDSECRYLCRLSRLSFEKQAIAGMSMAMKLRPTQNASRFSRVYGADLLLRSQSTSFAGSRLCHLRRR